MRATGCASLPCSSLSVSLIHLSRRPSSVCLSLTSVAQHRRSSSNTLYLQKCIFNVIDFSFDTIWSIDLICLDVFFIFLLLCPLPSKCIIHWGRYFFFWGSGISSVEGLTSICWRQMLPFWMFLFFFFFVLHLGSSLNCAFSPGSTPAQLDCWD